MVSKLSYFLPSSIHTLSELTQIVFGKPEAPRVVLHPLLHAQVARHPKRPKNETRRTRDYPPPLSSEQPLGADSPDVLGEVNRNPKLARVAWQVVAKAKPMLMQAALDIVEAQEAHRGVGPVMPGAWPYEVEFQAQPSVPASNIVLSPLEKLPVELIRQIGEDPEVAGLLSMSSRTLLNALLEESSLQMIERRCEFLLTPEPRAEPASFHELLGQLLGQLLRSEPRSEPASFHQLLGQLLRSYIELQTGAAFDFIERPLRPRSINEQHLFETLQRMGTTPRHAHRSFNVGKPVTLNEIIQLLGTPADSLGRGGSGALGLSVSRRGALESIEWLMCRAGVRNADGVPLRLTGENALSPEKLFDTLKRYEWIKGNDAALAGQLPDENGLGGTGTKALNRLVE